MKVWQRKRLSAPSQAYKSELKVNFVSKNSLTRKLNLMMGAKISHLRTHQVQSSSEWECLSCWPWGRVGGGSFVILLFTCCKGFVVTWDLTWCSHYTLFSLGPASSCHDHWHGHSCSAPLAHGAQSARRARALFPSVPCLLWITGASPVHSAEDPWPGHRAPNRKRNWDPEHCVMVTNSEKEEWAAEGEFWWQQLPVIRQGQGPRQEAVSCEPELGWWVWL